MFRYWYNIIMDCNWLYTITDNLDISAVLIVTVKCTQYGFLVLGKGLIQYLVQYTISPFTFPPICNYR